MALCFQSALGGSDLSRINASFSAMSTKSMVNGAYIGRSPAAVDMQVIVNPLLARREVRIWGTTHSSFDRRMLR